MPDEDQEETDIGTIPNRKGEEAGRQRFFLYMKKIYLHDVPPQADDLKKEMVDDCEVRGAA